MSKNVSELCVLLLRDMYGEVSARVVDMLLRYGRTSLVSLVRRVKLPERIVKQNLVVLIQQHLVRHYTQPDTGAIFYECDWGHVYEILHVGRVVRATQERFGEDGASVISNFILLGHAKVSDFISAYGLSTARKTAHPLANGVNGVNGVNGTNGTATADTAGTGGPINSIVKLKQVIVQLLKQKFLVQVLETDMQPEADALNYLQEKYTSELGGTTSTKIALENAIKSRIEEHIREQEDLRLNVHAGLKRKSAFGQSKSHKRRKMNMEDEDDDDRFEDDGWELDENMVLRVNHDKYLMIFRNAQIVKCVEGRISRTTSLVIAEMLNNLEKRQFGCHIQTLGNKTKAQTVTTFDINKTLNSDLNLNKSIAYTEAEQWVESQLKNAKKRPLTNGVNGHMNGNGNGNGSGHATDADDDDDDDDDDADGEDMDFDDEDPEAREKKKRLLQIKDHMLLLANDPIKFVKQVSNRGFGEWEIDFEPVMKAMRRMEMENIVEDAHGSIAVRLLRILRDKGKLDEKQLAAVSLLKQQDIRQHLARLHERGYIEIQEVPRSNDRMPSRTIFLFFYDDERALPRLMENIYKTMSRLLERVGRERCRHEVLLEKSERTDVIGNEEELLTDQEKKELEGWKETQSRLLGQLLRLDTQIMLFRDW